MAPAAQSYAHQHIDSASQSTNCLLPRSLCKAGQNSMHTIDDNATRSHEAQQTKMKNRRRGQKNKTQKEKRGKSKCMPAVVAARLAAEDDNPKPNQRQPRIRFLGVPEDVEQVHRYLPGARGYHPIHIDDTLDGGRYRVVHKLGYGGFSTVWLCLDTLAAQPIYVAVKVLVAQENGRRELDIGKHLEKLEEHQHFCLPQRSFDLQGGNGLHVCIVYPVMGPTLGSAMKVFAKEENPEDTVRRLLEQVAEALAVLHKNGICHGDLHPNNVFIELESLDGLDQPDVYKIFGAPQADDVTVKDCTGEEVIPGYLVYPIRAQDIAPQYLLPRIRIADFGESFYYNEELPRVTRIPRPYCAPEAVLAQTSGPASDLWSLGCLFFQTRLCSKIIEPGDSCRRSDEEYIISLVLILGRLPELWWDKWNQRHEYFRPDNHGDNDQGEQRNGTHEYLEKQPGKLPSIMSWELKEPRSIREKIIASCYSAKADGKKLVKNHNMTEVELDGLANLLGQLLRYNPEERLSAGDAANHEWFKMSNNHIK